MARKGGRFSNRPRRPARSGRQSESSTQTKIEMAQKCHWIRMAWLHSNQSKTILSYDIGALAFCGATLILALLLGSFHQVGNFDVETDFYWRYAVEAQNILAGYPYTDQLHPPGYTVLLAGVSL